VSGGRVQSWTWVAQPGRPFFGAAIGKRLAETQREIEGVFWRVAERLPNVN